MLLRDETAVLPALRVRIRTVEVKGRAGCLGGHHGLHVDVDAAIQGIRSFVGDGSVSFLSLVVLSIK
jgi:hypothetical protein